METLTSWEERGLEKGREEERQAIALKMLQGNLPLEQISQFTGLTLEQIQALQTQAPSA